MARHRPERLGEALARSLSKRGLGERLRVHALNEKWRRAVGEEIAPHTRVLSFARGVLRVQVDSSALLQELASVYTEAITRSLGSGEGPLAVRQIRFQLPR